MVLKLHVGDPELDRDDWYQRVRAALRGLTKDGQVDMLNLNRFRLAEDEGTVTWKLNVRFNDEELMQVEVLVSTSTCMSSSSLNRTFSFHVTVPSSSASLNRFRFSMSTCPSLVRPLSAARTRWYQSSRSSSGSPTCSLSTVAPTCCAVAPRKDPSSPARSSASSRGSPPPPPPTPTPVPKSM